MADPSAHGRRFSVNGASASGRRDDGATAGFRSVLTRPGDDRADLIADQPDFFDDLNLDQVVEAVTAGREEYDLEPFFYLSLNDPGAVRYRQEVVRDLEKPGVLESVRSFADAMRRMREHLAHSEKAHHELERDSWFVDAIEIYCLAADARTVKQAIAEIRYRVRIQAPRVIVSEYEGDEDYSVEVLETFARFRQGAVKSYLVSLPDTLGMNHVEARILDLVAQLNPVAFGRRAEFCARHRDFLDHTIARFDREVQFYVAYIELMERLQAAALPFCYPRVSAQSPEVAATEAFDIALANKLVAEGREVVGNDFHLDGPERMFVVSGPNNGGKTTFARMFGQLHHLAGLGLPVPGRAAHLFLPDRVFTHFEREEDIETLRGKFDDELVRVHRILEQATSRSVIVMNESFNSTTLNDALFVGTEVVHRIVGLGCLGVYVTFVDEIASLNEATVSMVTEVVPENPAQRTFRVLRRPADGLAYAWAIADKYGLTYDRLMERIAP